MRILKSLLVLTALLAGQTPRRILVVTAGSADYIWAAGGTLAAFLQNGYTVDVAQFGNDEKFSGGLSPSQTRLANVEDGKQAAQLLGVRDTVYLAHQSGQTGQVSSSEMRTQLFALIRHLRPQIIFIPDPYVHYQDDQDQYYVGKMAEEAWGYSGAATFANEVERMGFKPYGAPEIYYYAVSRPYRPGEGAAGQAQFRPVDITSTIDIKCAALELLRTRNRVQTMPAQRAGVLPQPLDEGSVRKFIRAYAEELAETIGRKHGFRYGEEFNHVNTSVGAGELPAHVRERAVPKR